MKRKVDTAPASTSSANRQLTRKAEQENMEAELMTDEGRFMSPDELDERTDLQADVHQAAKATLAPVSADVPPAEAGISLNWRMVDPDGCDVQFTMRGTFADDWKYIVTRRAELVKMAKKNGWTAQGNAPAQAKQPVSTDAAEATGKGAGPTPQPKPATPAPAKGGPGGKPIVELVAAKVDIVPEANGKTQVKFYEAGHKYPDIYTTKPAANLATMLGWDIEEFGKAQTFENLNIVVGYTLSDKLNTKGNPYKDIEYIKA